MSSRMIGRGPGGFPPDLVAHNLPLGTKLGKLALGVHGRGRGEVPQSMGLFLITGRLVWSSPHPSLLRLKPSGVTTLPK